MELNHSLLKEAAEHGLISEQQAEQLWSFLGERGKDTPSFRFTHILYYLGGLIAIGAMSLFMTLGWERWTGTAGHAVGIDRFGASASHSVGFEYPGEGDQRPLKTSRPKGFSSGAAAKPRMTARPP
jgi:hypothetical protein